ncbi:hypothetical protein [Phocaeicola sp.]
MKKFLINVWLAGGMVVALLALLLIVVPQDKDAYLMAYNKKCLLLDSVPSPRIIFVGGSNLCFSLDSKRVKDSLHINVVNYGLHAGIGLKFMIDDVEQYVREGDVIVFAPEYEHFYNCMYGEAETIAPLMAYSHWGKWDLLNGRQVIQVMVGIPSILQQDIVGFFPKKENVYRLSGINEYGDESKHWKLPDRTVAPGKPIKESLNEGFGYYFIEKIKRMEKKARVVIVPPVLRFTSYKVMEPQVIAVSCFLKESGHPFLVSAEHHVLPDSCAYDTKYHMNKNGVDRFTSLLIEELKEYLNDK